jgi:hypothetical protein
MYMSTHRYKHTHTRSISISTFKELSWLDFEIHEVGH